MPGFLASIACDVCVSATVIDESSVCSGGRPVLIGVDFHGDGEIDDVVEYQRLLRQYVHLQRGVTFMQSADERRDELILHRQN